MSVTGILHAVHTSPPAQEAINQTQKFVVELKTLFFYRYFILFIFLYLVLFVHFPTGERQGMGVVWPISLVKNFSSFSNHSIQVIFLYSSISLCFPCGAGYFPSTAKNTRKVWFPFPVGPCLTTPPSKRPRVCKGPELERITGHQQGLTRCSCHLHH